jgi:ATP-dependent Clp protease protease subunit
LSLNGYIDDESWFGDEITPESLHDLLYGTEDTLPEDVHIRLNSYGGSCNAAVRMFDDIRAYPGNVMITISGTAASAATVVAMAADRLEMTPGSLFMIHDPSTVAYGNERDMDEAKAVLHACKESILNMYGTRIRVSREDVADMMSATSWMDANEAFDKGFVDGITETPDKLPTDSVEHKVTLDTAKAGVQAWFDRKTKPFSLQRKPDGLRNSAQSDAPKTQEQPVPDNRVPILQTDTRLEHLRY